MLALWRVQAILLLPVDDDVSLVNRADERSMLHLLLSPVSKQLALDLRLGPAAAERSICIGVQLTARPPVALRRIPPTGRAFLRALFPDSQPLVLASDAVIVIALLLVDRRYRRVHF